MTGKILNLKIYVTVKNLEKMEQIREYLNAQNDVCSGDADRWTKTAVYQLIFNDAIDNFKI